jgi:putative transposase
MGKSYPTVAALWQRHWERLEPVFQYPPQIRRLLYTTNAIESLHMQLRKVIKNRGHFPSDEAATKLLYMALRNVVTKWRRSPGEWARAMPHLALVFGDRFMTEV